MSLASLDWKDITAVAGTVLALATLLKGVIEYVRQGAQKRAELFTSLQKRFTENHSLDAISDLLEQRSPELMTVAVKDRSAFLRYFEEIALMMQSGLIRKDVAHYMFGYYAIRCWESEYFWGDEKQERAGPRRDGPYWHLFRAFAAEMAALENKAPFAVSQFRF